MGAGLLGILVFAVAGCSGPVVAPYPAWQAEFDRALARDDLSDFQRHILQDFDVTDAEYDEAQQRWQGCVEDYGFTVMMSSGGYSVEDPSTNWGSTAAEREAAQRLMDEATDECGMEYTWEVGSIYRGIKSNPEHDNPTVAQVECFVRNGIVDPDFTVEDFDAYMMGGGDPIELDRSKDYVIVWCMQDPSAH